jgi:hypothetical protein
MTQRTGAHGDKDERRSRVFSESRVECLIRPVLRGDGHGDTRDAPGSKRRSAWGTPRRKTARPGPSPAVEWRIYEGRGLA